MMLVCSVLTALAALLWLVRATMLLVTIDGESMAPAYHHGDRVLAMRGAGRLRPGRLVIFSWAPAGTGVLVKRVAAVPGDVVPRPLDHAVRDATVPPGSVLVTGDGPGSVDSREWGYLPISQILGVVLLPSRGSSRSGTPRG